MTKSLRRPAAAVLGAVALGGATAVASQAPAAASAFSAAYSCSVPVLGTRPVVISGTLTASPERTAAGAPVRFRLHIASLSLQSPVVLNSWSATARINVGGAQTASFRLTGSGGPVPPHQPISGDLTGVWGPKAHGIDQLKGGDVTIRANVPVLGNVISLCVPRSPRPVLETLTVVPSAHDITSPVRHRRAYPPFGRP